MLLSCLKSFLSSPLLLGWSLKFLTRHVRSMAYKVPGLCLQLQLQCPALYLQPLLYSRLENFLNSAWPAVQQHWGSDIDRFLERLSHLLSLGWLRLPSVSLSSFLLSILVYSAPHYKCHLSCYLSVLLTRPNVLCGQGSCSQYNAWALNSSWPIVGSHQIWAEGRMGQRREWVWQTSLEKSKRNHVKVIPTLSEKAQ